MRVGARALVVNCPVDRGDGGFEPVGPDRDGVLHCRSITEAALQTLAGEHAQYEVRTPLA